MSLFTIDYEANGVGCIKNKVKEFLDGWYEVFDPDKEHRLEEVKLSGVLTGRIWWRTNENEQGQIGVAWIECNGTKAKIFVKGNEEDKYKYVCESVSASGQVL